MKLKPKWFIVQGSGLGLLCLVIFSLWLLAYGLLYAQDDYLEVKENTKADTITFSGNRWVDPVAGVKGEIFYNSILKSPRHFDGNAWNNFIGTDRAVPSKIVAASNSLDKSRADSNYVCTGTQTTGGDELKINQAITDLGANGGVVYLLEGNFWITNSINVPSNVAIIGAGAGTVISPKNAATLNVRGVINNSDSSGGNSYILLQNFKIDGNKANNGNTQYGIYFTKVASCKIDRVWIENMRSRGIFLNNSSNNFISGSHIQMNDDVGIYLYSSSSGNIISSNNLQSNLTDGIYINSCSGNIISSNNVQANTRHGIFLGSSSSNNIISGNNVQSNSTGNGIVLNNPSSNNVISGNNVQSNGLDGIALATNPAGNIILGNSASSNLHQGICLNYSSHNIISGNAIYNNGGSGNYDGIAVGYNSDNNIVSSNMLYDSSGTGYPIYIGFDDSGSNLSQNNYLVGNLFSSWPANYNKVNDNGTGTTYTDKTKITQQPLTINTTASSYTLDVANNPHSFVKVSTSANPMTLTLANGQSPGDLLIIQYSGILKSVVIYQAANLNLEQPLASISLQYGDILKLIWNGTKWLEMDYVDN